MIHELKIAPCYFEAVLSGDKTFEIRDNKDRGFNRGDKVKLREFDKTKHPVSSFCYSGREIDAVITYVTNYEQKDGFVVFSFSVR